MSVDDLDFADVDFQRTALKVVVCQARFDPLLRMAYEPPIGFQETIRHIFPQLESRSAVPTIALTIGDGGVEPQIPVPHEAEQIQPQVWKFRTADNLWSVGLDAASFSLETTDYNTFEDFAERFRVVFEAMLASYPQIDHFTRVGLRFVNVFDVATFGGDGWLRKFNPTLMGAAADEIVGPSVQTSVHQLILAENDWVIKLRYGNERNGDYRLDLDHAVEGQVPVADVPGRIAEFNQRLYNIFRWATSEEMYNDMGPQPRA